MMILRFWSPNNVPLVSIGGMIVGKLKGNDLRVILNRHIEENLILNVSFFPTHEATAFRREFIEPALDSEGYPVPGKYSVKSKLLYGREVEYLVDVVPYSRRLEDKQETISWRRGTTQAEICRDIINKLKGYEIPLNRRPIPRFVWPSVSSGTKYDSRFEEFMKYVNQQMPFVTNDYDCFASRISFEEFMKIMSKNRIGKDESKPYFYNPNLMPDWDLRLSVPQLIAYCRGFDIELSDRPSKAECERAAKESSEKMQGITKDVFDDLFKDLEIIPKAHADALKAMDAELRLARLPKQTIKKENREE